jgi:hypothetical protein
VRECGHRVMFQIPSGSMKNRSSQIGRWHVEGIFLPR